MKDFFVDVFDRFKLINIGLIFILFIFVLFLTFGQMLYGYIDQKEFPNPMELPNDITALTENEKGILLLDSITHQLKMEMNSTFGWTANDIIFNKYILDNRAYRQYGVYNSTRILMDIYSRVIAKLGNNDRENDNLYKAKSSYFTLSPDRWAIISESSESAYKKGFNEIEKYKNDLTNNKAVYNCKTDDIHYALTIICGDQILGYAMGLLENAEELPWYQLDNRIYEAQGMILVVRDFLNTVYKLYPNIMSKNNEENFSQAMYYLTQICVYDPIWIATNPFNNGALIRSYLLNVQNRIQDIANSLKI